jgi:hypothetical protein
MKSPFTIGFLTAAIISPLAALADERPPVADAGDGTTPYYVRGPRIIQVPPPGELGERVEHRASLGDDIGDSEKIDRTPRRYKEVSAPAPRRHVAPKPHRRAELAPARKPFSMSPPLPSPPPPPAGPRRAVLSAPPLRTDDPSPIYPTPRFEAKAAPSKMPASPPETTVTADTPPPGYTPPPMPPAPPAATPADDRPKDEP